MTTSDLNRYHADRDSMYRLLGKRTALTEVMHGIETRRTTNDRRIVGITKRLNRFEIKNGIPVTK